MSICKCGARVSVVCVCVYRCMLYMHYTGCCVHEKLGKVIRCLVLPLSAVFPQDRISHWNWSWAGDPQAPAIFLSYPSVALGLYRCAQLCMAFYMGAKDLVLGPHVYTASTLSCWDNIQLGEMRYHTQFMQSWESNPGLQQARQALSLLIYASSP